MKTRMLAERCNKRHVSEFMTPEFIVRAELQRVARQVRGKKNARPHDVAKTDWGKGYISACKDVLALLKEAKK